MPDTNPCRGAGAPLDLEALENLANAATKGPWKVRSSPGLLSFVSAPRENPRHGYDIEVLGEDETQYSTRDADVAYIAAAQPQVVLELIRQLRDARRLHDML
ncbi:MULTISPECIES: hypothetical protein [unclassified Variovorax]|uniref:hypothetical protein n=1 Tax=unclassified Variovorax TaxID=663243 RepID=UPI00076CD052|nr:MULTISPECIES: hypothetical protein [unclassified Variovorax]KWT98114.1 hypothetical protein APY03_0785 [Variovorax sp. WDL1]PNG50411.1 hypothetical protein CHC06_06035 [Variovorax sp. B2]PNG51284.1 hypothetical protein CHC07_05941 [Variovorax sp. B4]VTV17535.1 hypothetical protein WDL1P1_00466 [Variovorax sp. WDL1]